MGGAAAPARSRAAGLSGLTAMVEIAVFGAGAIGTWLAARLAAGGARVTLVGRAATVAHLAGHPLRLREAGEETVVPGVSVATAREAGDWVFHASQGASGRAFDAVLVTTKSHHLGAALDDIAGLIGPKTVVAFLQNGIPWWYFQGLTGPFAGRAPRDLDPRGELAARLPLDRVLGAVVHKSTRLPEPGVVEATRANGDRIVFGSPDGSVPPGWETLAAALSAAAIDARFTPDIRAEIWAKLLGNAALNPISALARADIGEILDHPPTRRLVREVMEEVVALAASLGTTIPQTPDERIERSRAVGRVRTSMLQDVDRGVALEVDGILGPLVEISEWTGVAAPRLAALHAATSLLSLSLTRSPSKESVP